MISWTYQQSACFEAWVNKYVKLSLLIQTNSELHLNRESHYGMNLELFIMLAKCRQNSVFNWRSVENRVTQEKENTT